MPATRSDAGARKGRGKRPGRARETATGLISRVPVPRGRGAGVSGAAKVLLGAVAGVLVIVIALILVFNSGVFKIKTIEVNGSEHVSQATVEQLVDVPEGTTYFNVDEDAILASLQKIAWVADVDIQKTFPSTISITPVEHEVALLVYSNTDDVAWLVSAAGTWISPVSLVAAVDEDGDAVEQLEDGTWPEGATELSGEEAALAVAATYGALLVTDIPSSVEPSAGSEVDSDEVEAALAYVQGFSEEFLAQIKSLSAASVESLAAILTSGVEVALGPAEDIETKEQVITTLLEEQEGVTYINVREADAYTFRSTPTSE